MSDLAAYHNDKRRIIDLLKQVEVQRTLKYKAIKSRDKCRVNKVKTVNTLLMLHGKGLINLTSQQIADACFIEVSSVIEARSKLFKELK